MNHLSPLWIGIFFLVPIVLLTWFRTHFPVPNPYPLIRDTSIKTFQQYLNNGSYTSEDLVRTFLARISEVNNKLHAVAEINPDAINVARHPDRDRHISGPRSELHGIPILIKDIVSTHGMNNTAGLYCLIGSKTKQESSLIARLRKAGAIILGKANTSEWGNNRSFSGNSSNGRSAWDGQTYGVYTNIQDPCGSSSGSATSMALGLSVATIGVEFLEGRITCPAMKSNIVSIKPTAHLVPKDNVLIAQLRGAIGPMTLIVMDTAQMSAIMAGKSDADPYTKDIPLKKIPDYVAACKQDALHGMDGEYTISPQGIYGPAGYAADMAGYLSGLETNPMRIQNIFDMISCTKSDPSEEYSSRDIGNFEKAAAPPAVNSAEVQSARKLVLSLAREGGIDGALDSAKANALILPSIICSDIPGFAGYPTITVPMEYMPDDTPVVKNPRGDLVDEAPNIPFGLCFIGRAWSEEKLVGLAYAFEQLTKVGSERRPIILPKAELRDIVKNRNT
ncbi:amidase [Bisporella sp. PMI_857]|nr:amidase [Bisporella sp. PMI_857]